MTWSYSGNPQSSPKDKVRRFLGDVVASDPEVTDEEILSQLIDTPVPRQAAAALALQLSAQYARLVPKAVGGLATQYQIKYDHFIELYRQLSGVRGNDPTSIPPGAGPKTATALDTQPFFVRRPVP